MTNRPSPEQSADGADAIGALLSHARQVHAKDVFTDTDLAHADVTDPRWQVAAATAARPTEGWRITQVLAGGTQLVRRMTLPAGEGGFSNAAKAILLACGDLRRVGMDNPLPLWAIRGAAPGYLDPPDPTPPEDWLPGAFGETTDTDNPLTGIYNYDHYALGAPALTRHWTTTEDGASLEVYSLHDYLYQHHQTTRRYTPTRQQLWDTLTTGSLTRDTAFRIARDAADRGLYAAAITLLTPAANKDESLRVMLERLLIERGDKAGLQAEADAGDWYAQRRLADLLAEWGDEEGLEARADYYGDRSAQDRLAELLYERGDEEGLRARSDQAARRWLAELLYERSDLKGLEAQADATTDDDSLPAQNRLADLLYERRDLEGLRARSDSPAKKRLADLLAEHDEEELRALADAGDNEAKNRLADLLYERGDEEGLRARFVAGDWSAKMRLTDLMYDRGNVDQVRALADENNWRGRIRLAEMLRERGDEEGLRAAAAAGDWEGMDAEANLLGLLAERGDKEKLLEMIHAGDKGVQGTLVELLYERKEEDELRRQVWAGLGGQELIQLYAAEEKSGGNRVRELDVWALPVWSSVSPSPLPVSAGEPVECIEVGMDPGCQGPVEVREALPRKWPVPESGCRFPRCEEHWRRRLERQQQIEHRGQAQGEDD
jgi:hypothetical protein